MQITKEKLIEFYSEQYREIVRRSSKKTVKAHHYMHRLNTKAKSMARGHANQNQGRAMNLMHQDIKRLAFLAYLVNNKNATRLFNKEIIPNLVRMDLEMFEKDFPDDLNEEFIRLLRKEKFGAICKKNLRELYLDSKSEAVRKDIVNLVPARPELEFPETLEMKRHFILHVGPTNSGKTYQSLERLKTATCGVYLGPLRLLALEVYEKMSDNGIPCTMLTGQECIEEPNSRITASTIEMLDMDKKYDVAVIDEAQMIADSDRGHSWTRAILGVKADEIHLCMSPVAKDVIIHLIELCGDTYEINNYERKTPLVIMDKPFIFPDDVEDGDALIVFSKKSVLNIAGRLEETGIGASVIYGSLPPEIRRRQMQMFNSGETKVVVSTDAIGMGLNLPVKRIIFLEIDKFDGTSRRPLNIGEIKQIAGRAGRYGLYENGYVAGMDESCHRFLEKMWDKEEEDIEVVSLGFPQILLSIDAPLDVIVKLWHEVKPFAPFEKIKIDDMIFLYSEAHKDRFFIEDFDDKYVLYKMITCPIDIKDREVVSQWKRYCLSYTADISLDHPDKRSRYQGLMKYESYYKKLDLYYQFSVRMGKLIDVDWLDEEREKTQSKIMQLLAKDKNEYITRCKYCGKILPLGTKFNVCANCYSFKAYTRW